MIHVPWCFILPNMVQFLNLGASKPVVGPLKYSKCVWRKQSFFALIWPKLPVYLHARVNFYCHILEMFVLNQMHSLECLVFIGSVIVLIRLSLFHWHTEESVNITSEIKTSLWMLDLETVHLLVEQPAEGFCLTCTWHLLGLLTTARGSESNWFHTVWRDTRWLWLAPR